MAGRDVPEPGWHELASVLARRGSADVVDVYVNNLSSLEVDGFDGFRPSSTRLVFTGICRRCAESSGYFCPMPWTTKSSIASQRILLMPR